MRMTAGVRSLFLVVVLLCFLAVSFGQIGITVSFGPPALPVYEQPPCPSEGYIWTPGYWAWDPDAGQYFWVPGTWVLAPEPGYLWTPAWWGWGPGGFIFHEGFWGPRIGFYGGINYGYGYFGNGYDGGRWDRGQFYYNRTVNNVNVTNIHNTYNTTVINNNTTINRVSYNGGNGGVTARPTAEEEAVDRGRHIAPVAAQTQHIQAARANPELRESANHGRPPIAATDKPGEFRGRGATPAREAGAPYRPTTERAVPRPEGTAPGERNVPRPTHASDLPQHQPAHPNTGNPQLDQKYQRQQEKLYNKLNQQHQKLENKQQAEDQRLAQRHANEAQRQQMEQRHQQQTQQMQQRHEQQMQHLQQRQSPPPREAPSREGPPPHK